MILKKCTKKLWWKYESELATKVSNICVVNIVENCQRR